MTNKIPTVISMVQTSSGYPNQFEGRFSDGDFFYCHAEYSLRITKSPTEDDMANAKYQIIGDQSVTGSPDLPKHLGIWHDLTIQELIDFCKEKELPIRFELAESKYSPIIESLNNVLREHKDAMTLDHHVLILNLINNMQKLIIRDG